MTDEVTLKLPQGDQDYPVLEGSVGPEVIDIRKLYGQTGMFTYDPGFTSTASCQSAITYIDGEKGILLHRGYPIDQLAEQSTFMEVAYLLLYGELPKKDELDKIIATTEKEEKHFNKLSVEAREKVEPRLLHSYDRIRSNYRNGLAVVPVLRDACGGCFNAIPPQRQSEIRQRKKIIVCENCGRILVDNELNDQIEVK